MRKTKAGPGERRIYIDEGQVSGVPDNGFDATIERAESHVDDADEMEWQAILRHEGEEESRVERELHHIDHKVKVEDRYRLALPSTKQKHQWNNIYDNSNIDERRMNKTVDIKT